MNHVMNRLVEEVKALDTPSHTPPGAEGWKDVLQLLKVQCAKMEKLARALSVIQQGMLRNNPGHVKDSVNEASEVLSGTLNTNKCLLESGVEIQKKLESHPASKKMGFFRRLRSASLGDTPKKLTKGEKRVAPSPPEDRLPKKGKGGTSPSYAAVTRGQTPQKDGVSKRTLEVRDLEETVTREEVVAVLCIALGNPDLGDQCKLYKRFGGVQTAVVRLNEADARSLLGLGKLRVG